MYIPFVESVLLPVIHVTKYSPVLVLKNIYKYDVMKCQSMYDIPLVYYLTMLVGLIDKRI